MSINSGFRDTARKWWRWLSIFSVLAMSGAVAVVSASPAGADSNSAMRHCVSGAWPQIDASVNLAGNNSAGVGIPSTQDPPNILNYGDVYRVDASGSVRVDYWGQGWGPGGNGFMAPQKGWPFPNNIQFSDILRFNHSGPNGGWVGSPQQATQFGGCRQWWGPPVRFLFYVNDPGLGDNAGYWTNHVQIWQASAPE